MLSRGQKQLIYGYSKLGRVAMSHLLKEKLFQLLKSDCYAMKAEQVEVECYFRPNTRQEI